MANSCALCGKKTTFGRKYYKLMSRYNPSPKKKKKPNLQWVKLSSRKRIKACAKCIKTLSKEK